MHIVDHLHDASINLLSSKLRSFLALLGILVGTASVVAMVSGGQLATNQALNEFKQLGTDLLAVSIIDQPREEKNAEQPHASLTLNQALEINQNQPSILTVAPFTQAYGTLLFAGHIINGSVTGVTSDFASTIHLALEQGRAISTLDKEAFYCVIGSYIAEQIKKITAANPLGQQLQIGHYYFTIIGIAKQWKENSFVYTNINSGVMVPLLTSKLLSKYASINNIIFKLQPNAEIEPTKKIISDYININSGKHFYYFRSAEELIQSMSKQNHILTLFLAMVGSISLLVGGIGIMNIMLVSVIERRREIGIRLAVGAQAADIRSLFLVEAILLSFIGGSLGVIFGMAIAYIIALLWHWEFILLVWPALIGFFVSTAVGIFFGFYPAYQASKLLPIEALRTE